MFRQLLECGIDLAGLLQAFPEVQGIVEIDVEHDEWCSVYLRGMDDWTCMKRAYAVTHASRRATSLDAVITIGHHRISKERNSVVWGESVYHSVHLGGRRHIKKKH